MRAAALGLVVLGCAVLPVSAVVKPPLQSQCERLPIKGCGELVDGALLYAQGNKPGALQKIDLAKQQNSPAELRQFGDALRQAASLPGAESVAQPLNEVADLLGTPGSPVEQPTGKPPKGSVTVATNTVVSVSAAKVTASAATAPDEGLVQLDAREYLVARAMSAPTDPNRIISNTFDLSDKDGRTPCKVFDSDAICFRGRQGPLIVTDIIGASACPDRLFMGATESDTTLFGFHWLFEAPKTPLTGARFVVRAGEWIQFVIIPSKKGLSESVECQISWSGFRPFFIP